MEFSGRLGTIQFGDVLQLASQERWSGGLVVRRTSREKRVFLEAGKIVGCLSDDPAEFYGRHLLLYDHVDEAQLARALSWCQDHGRRLGTALRELEILPEARVTATLAQRTADAVCDLFLWSRGIFYLEADRPPDEELAADPLDVFGLVLEGTRWLDEYRRIRALLANDRVVLRHGPAWPPADDVPPLQRKVAAAVDGKRDLATIHQHLGGSHFRFLEAAWCLCLAEVLDIADVGVEEVAMTTEISLLDVMMEQQASEERTLLSERHFSVPLDLLVHLVPAWTRRRDPRDDRDEVPGAAESRFLAGINGRSPIRDLLSTSAEARSRQLDLLLVELRRGRIALLPAPLGELDLQG